MAVNVSARERELFWFTTPSLWGLSAVVSQGSGVTQTSKTWVSPCHNVTGLWDMRLKALAGVVNARKRELVFSFRMLCQNVYQVIQVQANEVLTKRIRSIKCNLMRQDGGVSGGAQKMNLSFVSRLTCTWNQIRWKQCQTMVAPCLGSQEGDCFSIFSKPDCPQTTFSPSHKNPELHPFPETKKATIEFTANLSSSESGCIFWSPIPPIRCI